MSIKAWLAVQSFDDSTPPQSLIKKADAFFLNFALHLQSLILFL